MDKFRAMQLYVRLAEVGSFTQLADELGTSKSLVSKEISRLEAALGARLLNRSTRRLQLTQTGEGYLERCRQILAQLEDADAFVQRSHDQPAGRLRINAPMALGVGELARAFSAFMQAYPAIELDVQLGDDWVDLVEHGFDLGLRAASRPFDSSYVGKPLTSFSYRVCASPAYVAQHEPIEGLDDLKRHNCFIYSYFRGRSEWPLGAGVLVEGNLRVNSTLFMRQAILDGLGIGFLPDFVCGDDVHSGRLTELLATLPRPKLTLYAMYPARRFVPSKLTHCVSFLEDWFARPRGSELLR